MFEQHLEQRTYAIMIDNKHCAKSGSPTQLVYKEAVSCLPRKAILLNPEMLTDMILTH